MSGSSRPPPCEQTRFDRFEHRRRMNALDQSTVDGSQRLWIALRPDGRAFEPGVNLPQPVRRLRMPSRIVRQEQVIFPEGDPAGCHSPSSVH